MIMYAERKAISKTIKISVYIVQHVFGGKSIHFLKPQITK